jgi:hypothetical protein
MGTSEPSGSQFTTPGKRKEGAGEGCSFLKKRTKRLLSLRRLNLSGHGLDLCAGAELKVFWFFSSEKNMLPYLFDSIVASGGPCVN